MKTLGSLSISAEAIIDMHSLNNEGGEGNQIQTRMVDVVVRDQDNNPRIESVNAISGDMFKHIQAEHLFRIAQSNESLQLCNACKRFNANRISGDPAFIEFINKKKPNPAQVLDYLIQACMIDDLEGILITEGKQSVPRKSVVEFGWVVGRPESTRTGQYFHVKYNPEKPGQEGDDRSGNQGQAIFHRPASSGVYALVCNLELGRIGYNDLSQRYVLNESERLARYQALLKSVLYTLIRPAGAMRSAQLPHLVDIRGVVSYSTSTIPAPTFSAINPQFINQSTQVKAALNAGEAVESVVVEEFNDFASLSTILANLITNSGPLQFGLQTGR